MSEADDLRVRAERCRHFARTYANDVGTSLAELAVELDRKADRLDAQSRPDELPSGAPAS